MGTELGHIPAPEPRDAGADFTSSQHLLVKRSSATAVALATDGDEAIGPLQNYPGSGELANVATGGPAKVKLGEAVATAPAFLKPNDSSQGVACTLNGQPYSFVVNEEGASGQIVAGMAAAGRYCDAVDSKEQVDVDGAATLTTAQCGYGVVSLTGAAGNITTPTATDLVSDLGLTKDGQSVECLLINTTANNKTITAGTGVTLLKNEAATDFVIGNAEAAMIRFVRQSATTAVAACLKYTA